MMQGQTRIEFIFGIIIFAAIIFYIVNQTNNVFSTIISDYDTNQIKAEANSLVKILTFDKGYPENWFNFLTQGWEKRREINITIGPKELRDKQVRINVTYDSDMKSDFSDLRFTDSDKVTNIPYWIENKSNSYWALVWVNVPKIPNSGKKSIYMYYNNSLVNSESNGNNVFIQFLDLSGTSLPPGWLKTDIGTSGTATVSNGLLRITNTNGANIWQNNHQATHIHKNSTISGSFVAVARITGQNNTDSWAKAGISVQNYMSARNYNGIATMLTTPVGSGNGYAFQYLHWSDYYIGPDDNNNGGSVSFPTYLRIIRNESNVSGWYSSYGFVWTRIGYNVTPRAIENFQYVTLFVTPHDAAETGEANFSMFYVYQFTSPEPQGTIKSEENRTNETWFPVKTIGLANQPSMLSKEKIKALNENCNLLSNFKLNNYRLRVYNSTNLLLFCGTDTLRPAKVVVNKKVLIENDFGNVTLEMW